MRASRRGLSSKLSETDQEDLNCWREDFAKSWSPESLSQWVQKLPKLPDHLRRPALVELVKTDLEKQWKAGRPRKLEFYMKRYPDLGSPETVPIELIETEIDVVRQSGHPAVPSDYQRRFPQRVAELWPLFPAEQNSWERTDPAEPPEATPRIVGAGVASVTLPENFGRYQILSHLGEGGMGSVYRAFDSQLQREVAIKIPRLTPGADSQVIDRFLREARSAARLHHPNVCAVHDAGVIEGIHFISMAFVRGHRLSDEIRGKRPMNQNSAARVVETLAKAIHHAHEQGIIHRDLKPVNVMIDETNQPVILDFGLARKTDPSPLSRISHPNMLFGTPAYMSPEQVEGKPDQITHATDIYSLGVVLYELLTGEVPFQGSVASVYVKIKTEPPRRPSELRADLDPQLEAICLKMMAKEPANRYRTALEAADEIGEFLAREGASEPQPRVAQDCVSGRRGSRWRRARGWLILLGLFPLLFGVLIFLKTREGTIRIRLDDPSLKLIIDNDSFGVADLKGPLTFKTGSHSIFVETAGRKLAPGESLRIGPDKAQKTLVATFGGLELRGNPLEIRAGVNPALHISLVSEPKSPPSPQAPAPKGSDSIATDLVPGTIEKDMTLGEVPIAPGRAMQVRLKLPAEIDVYLKERGESTLLGINRLSNGTDVLVLKHDSKNRRTQIRFSNGGQTLEGWLDDERRVGPATK